MAFRLPYYRGGSLSDAARQLAAQGIHVVPMKRDRSRAHTRYANQSCPTPEQAAGYFERWKDALLCVKLPKNVVVLDLDPRDRRLDEIIDELDFLYSLPHTCSVRTPKGGLHIWLTIPPSIGARNWTSLHGRFPVKGVDIRTNRGLATMPPSRRDDGDYTWKSWVPKVSKAPKRLVSALTPKKCIQPSKIAIEFQTARNMAQYGKVALQLELERVMRAPKGARNHSLFVASANLGSLYASNIIPDPRRYLEQAAEFCGLTRDDGQVATAATIDSGWCRGLAQPRNASFGDFNA